MQKATVDRSELKETQLRSHQNVKRSCSWALPLPHNLAVAILDIVVAPLIVICAECRVKRVKFDQDKKNDMSSFC